MKRSGIPAAGLGALAPLVLALLLATACTTETGPSTSLAETPTPLGAPACTHGRLAPSTGIYYGVSLDWERDTLAAYTARLGRAPAVYIAFATFPFDRDGGTFIDGVVDQGAALGGALMLTLEPTGGLGAVNEAAAAELAARLAGYNRRGVPVFVRFGHEMNGSWYPWAQQPYAYIAAFRLIAQAVHRQAPGSAMVWAPNYGGGYPFSGGTYETHAEAFGFKTLDTNHDGRLSMADDPYEPYYPGDDAVDWVGMSLYHWGNTYPWGKNQAPEREKFLAQLTGGYRGAAGDDTAIPDFHALALRHCKPLAIAETAAFYRLGGGGDAELNIKQQWWQQVFRSDVPEILPQVKMINWFEWEKFETETGGRVNWGVTKDPALADHFRTALPSYLQFSETAPPAR